MKPILLRVFTILLLASHTGFSQTVQPSVDPMSHWWKDGRIVSDSSLPSLTVSVVPFPPESLSAVTVPAEDTAYQKVLAQQGVLAFPDTAEQGALANYPSLTLVRAMNPHRFDASGQLLPGDAPILLPRIEGGVEVVKGLADARLVPLNFDKFTDYRRTEINATIDGLLELRNTIVVAGKGNQLSEDQEKQLEIIRQQLSEAATAKNMIISKETFSNFGILGSVKPLVSVTFKLSSSFRRKYPNAQIWRVKPVWNDALDASMGSRPNSSLSSIEKALRPPISQFICTVAEIDAAHYVPRDDYTFWICLGEEKLLPPLTKTQLRRLSDSYDPGAVIGF